MLHTPLCTELGIEHPILSAGMGGISLARLVAAVSSAGGLGVLGGNTLTADELRSEIRAVRALTDKPFGVDLLIPQGLPPRAEDFDVPEPPDFLAELAAETRNLPEAPQRPTLTEEYCHNQLEVCVEERVPVLACALGTPEWVVEHAHAHDMKVLGLVGSVRQAVRVEQAGADYIVAQGTEAGGHTGEISTLVLVPAIVDAVKIPVIAAGGIADGRGLAAALVLGAQAVWVGTRFVATHQAVTPPNVQEEIVKIGVEGTVRTRAYTGKPTRVIRNRYTDLWKGKDSLAQPMPIQMLMVKPIVDKARAAGRFDISGYFAGQSAGLIHDIVDAGEVVATMVEGAEAALAARVSQ